MHGSDSNLIEKPLFMTRLVLGNGLVVARKPSSFSERGVRPRLSPIGCFTNAC
jgi:hypothetical protein